MKKSVVLFTLMVFISLLAIAYLFIEKERTYTQNFSNSRSAMQKLHHALTDYYSEYTAFPGAQNANRDTIQLTTGKGPNTLMASLCNLERGDGESPKKINFFSYREAVDKKAGLLRNEAGTYAELFDPWGNPYHVLLDYDYDGKLAHPHTGQVVEEKILIWSPGPDGKTGTPETNKDDIF